MTLPDEPAARAGRRLAGWVGGGTTGLARGLVGGGRITGCHRDIVPARLALPRPGGLGCYDRREIQQSSR